MNEIMYQKSYEEYKAELGGELQRAAESFVRIGYLLKVARDTNILAESGYKTMAEFAEAEFHLDKTKTSRFISINDRFSEGGYSDRLKEEYRGFEWSKLTIMLQLPEEMTEELSTDYTKAELNLLKSELDAENSVSDIEMAIERAEAEEKGVLPPEEKSMLGKAVWQLGIEHRDIYRKVWKAFEKADRRLVLDILAPQGESTIFVKIPGMGRYQISVKNDICVMHLRTLEKERYSIEEIVEELEKICPVAGMDVEEAYRSVYDMDLEPEKEPEKQPEKKTEVAPVQPKKEKRKESKVTKARTEKPEPAADVPEEEEQLPGQMSVKDYEGVVPEANYEEVKEDERTEDDGMSERSGAAGDALEPGIDAGASGETANADTTDQYYESTGIAESGGCETDSEQIEEIWMEIYKNHGEISKYLSVWESQHRLMNREMVKKLYDMSIAMAAGFERLMQKGQDNE